MGLPADKIVSERIANPTRGDLPQYEHQIDLRWETGDGVCLYLNIANAKWRSSAKVDQGEVLLLQQVRQKVRVPGLPKSGCVLQRDGAERRGFRWFDFSSASVHQGSGICVGCRTGVGWFRE